MKKCILITGATGYIGSHLILELYRLGYPLVLMDNLSHSSTRSIDILESCLGNSLNFHKGDIRDRDFLESLFLKYAIDTVIHLAAMKSVPESIQKPNLYHEVNTVGNQTLFEVMLKNDIHNILFASSSCVYGEGVSDINGPFSSDHAYGQSKIQGETILWEYAKQYNWNVRIFRLFNIIGCRSDLFPQYIKYNTYDVGMKVCESIRDQTPFTIYGNRYDTSDGTASRDYIDIYDVTRLIGTLIQNGYNGYDVYNVGSGESHTIKEFLTKAELVCEKKIIYQIGDIRPGDVGYSRADINHTLHEVPGWKPTIPLEKTLENMFTHL